MAYDNLLYEVDGGVATITVNRPKVLNSLNFETVDELESAFREAQEDSSVRVVVLTGAGDKAFVAGADVKEIHEFVREKVTEGREGIPLKGRSLVNLILDFGKPVIAAVNGYCLGGGCELVYACTLAYASESAKFGQPEISLGFNPCWGGTQHLARLVGVKKSMELTLLGEMFDASEALRLGIVNGVVPAEELMPTVRAVAQKLVEKSPPAVRSIMDCVRNAGDLTFEEGVDLEVKLVKQLCGTEDIIEGTLAFVEKRKPKFSGS